MDSLDLIDGSTPGGGSGTGVSAVKVLLEERRREREAKPLESDFIRLTAKNLKASQGSGSEYLDSVLEGTKDELDGKYFTKGVTGGRAIAVIASNRGQSGGRFPVGGGQDNFLFNGLSSNKPNMPPQREGVSLKAKRAKQLKGEEYADRLNERMASKSSKKSRISRLKQLY